MKSRKKTLMPHRHILWSEAKPYGPYYCERQDWKNCPEHKHLTNKRKTLRVSINLETSDTNNDTVDLDYYNNYSEQKYRFG